MYGMRQGVLRVLLTTITLTLLVLVLQVEASFGSFLPSISLPSRNLLLSHSSKHLKRQIDGGGQGDPGVYPGGDTQGAETGWRTLPTVTGANLDNSTFTVANGQATLVAYITADFDPTKIKRVIVEFAGENRDSWNQFLYLDLALDRAIQGGQVKREEVVIVAPMPFNIIDYGAYPSDLTQSSITNAMIWQDQGWADGTNVVYPQNVNASMFDALDSVVDHFMDQDTFPNLVTMVIAGFSLGAQSVQRYATFRNPNPIQDSKLKYWISSPGSFLYFNSKRPEKFKKSCKGVNDYKYGLDGILPPYYDRSTNSTSKLTSTLSKIEINDLIEGYLNKRIGYAVGLRDKIKGDPRCEADAQGKNHVIKMENWIDEALPEIAGLEKGQIPINSTVDYVKYIRHEDFRMIQSDAGIQRLFLDDYSAPTTSATAPPSNGDVNGSPKNSTDSNSIDGPTDPKSQDSSAMTMSCWTKDSGILLLGSAALIGIITLLI